MSNVNLTIGGRVFTVSAASGEETHVAMLGRMIDDRVRRIGAGANHTETRMLLFGALVLADELHEAHGAPGLPAQPEPEPDQAEANQPDPALSAAILARIEALAERIERLASQFGAVDASPVDPAR